MTDVHNVVLVHGGFVDGSGWQGVYEALTADGYRVAVVQNPTLSLEGDAALTRQVINGLDGPVVLAGHSYGGAVITAAGTHEKVAALVYIAAFAPDKGESVNTLIAGFPADGPQPPILPPQDGFLFLDRDKFHASFADDLPAGVPGQVGDDMPTGQLAKLIAPRIVFFEDRHTRKPALAAPSRQTPRASAPARMGLARDDRHRHHRGRRRDPGEPARHKSISSCQSITSRSSSPKPAASRSASTMAVIAWLRPNMRRGRPGTMPNPPSMVRSGKPVTKKVTTAPASSTLQ
jgi:pimeloyl-ACP methyl ester carboxylesterase